MNFLDVEWTLSLRGLCVGREYWVPGEVCWCNHLSMLYRSFILYHTPSLPFVHRLDVYHTFISVTLAVAVAV